MSIKRHQATANTVLPDMTEQEIDDAVASIVASHGTDIKSFQTASSMYNFDFFKGESQEFKTAACRALKAHFSDFQNSFWDKASADFA